MSDPGAARGSAGRLRALVLLWLVLPGACGGGAGDGLDGPGRPMDAAPDAPSLPVPRLIAPLSMAQVTQQRPLLRWEMPGGVTAPIVDLCRDRACTTPVPIGTEIADDRLSAAPQIALPPGWVYWRVRALSGGQMVSSATWQFWVGRSSATSLVDTGNGAIFDVNGDGYADFLVGAPRTFTESGMAYLYLGSATASAADWNGDAPTARIALARGFAFSEFGATLASAGDVNGDGYADFLIGAAGAAPAGEVHLYLGSGTPTAADWNGDGATRRIDLVDPVPGGHGFGVSVAGAGDVDGDGYGDFVVGGGPGARVYFGSATPSAGDWSAGASTRRIDLANPRLGGGYGVAVAGAGDVDGDGHADVLVGASNLSSDTASAFLYLGSASPSGTIWNKPSSARRIELTSPDGFFRGFAAALAGAGDINGDGYADFLIAAEFADGGDVTMESGAAHVYFGSAAPGEAGWNGTAASQRVDLVSPDGAIGTLGSALASAGDVNGDGFADFVVGNFQAGQAGGTAHVYLGGAAVDRSDWNGTVTHASRIDLLTPDGKDAHFGGSAGFIGDVDGDGFPEFIVGTFSSGFASSGGAAHVYRGLAKPGGSSWNGAAPAMRIDVASPSGQDTAFGNAVAITTRRADGLWKGLR